MQHVTIPTKILLKNGGVISELYTFPLENDVSSLLWNEIVVPSVG